MEYPRDDALGFLLQGLGEGLHSALRDTRGGRRPGLSACTSWL
jgi:hypothetical protein